MKFMKLILWLDNLKVLYGSISRQQNFLTYLDEDGSVFTKIRFYLPYNVFLNNKHSIELFVPDFGQIFF